MTMLEGLTQAGKRTQWAMDDAAGSSGAARPTPSEVDRRGLGLFDGYQKYSYPNVRHKVDRMIRAKWFKWSTSTNSIGDGCYANVEGAEETFYYY
jgi:hypothetical protein